MLTIMSRIASRKPWNFVEFLVWAKSSWKMDQWMGCLTNLMHWVVFNDDVEKFWNQRNFNDFIFENPIFLAALLLINVYLSSITSCEQHCSKTNSKMHNVLQDHHAEWLTPYGCSSFIYKESFCMINFYFSLI